MTPPPDNGVPHTAPQFVVAITLKEVYDAVVALTGRVDLSIYQQGEMRRDVDDHETRLRSLERGRWPLPALAALVSIAAVIFAGLAYFNR